MLEDTVFQIHVLEVVPNLFVGVELRRIAGLPDEFQAALGQCAEEFSDGLRAVVTGPVGPAGQIKVMGWGVLAINSLRNPMADWLPLSV